MKIYVAARFHEKDEVRRIYKLMIDKGHTITADWTKHKNVKPYSDNPKEAGNYSVEDMQGTLDSDVFIIISSKEAGGGVSAELGAAIAHHVASGKPKVYAVGPYFDPNAFYFHPSVTRCVSIAEILAEL